MAYLFLLCRHQIERLAHDRHSSPKGPFSEHAFHSACNAALFPLLFFFSALYYTDVVSTAAVLGAYLNHLSRVGCGRCSILSHVSTIGLGILALLMRQTNVFWVVVYMGGLEAAHAVKTLRPERVDQPFFLTLWEKLKYFTWRYSVGDVHDVPLDRAWPDGKRLDLPCSCPRAHLASDALFTVISLGVAAMCNPGRVLKQIWPYLTVLGAFVGFVAWNGGVVLGEFAGNAIMLAALGKLTRNRRQVEPRRHPSSCADALHLAPFRLFFAAAVPAICHLGCQGSEMDYQPFSKAVIQRCRT